MLKQASISAVSITTATNMAITNDVATNATMFPIWSTANSGNQAYYVSSTKLTYNPSTGTFGTIVLDLADSTAPTKAAGHAKLYSSALAGSSRVAVSQNLGSTDFILGRDNVLVAHNTTGSILPKGSAVRIVFFSSTYPSVVPAQANSQTSLPCLGLCVDAIPAFGDGFIMKLGMLSGLDTSAFSINDILYVSPTVAGGLTNVRPSGATNFVDQVGIVFNVSATVGQILARCTSPLLNRETGTNQATWTGKAVVANSLTLKQGANGKVGTFVATGATPVTVSNTSVAITDCIMFSLNTVGGTVGAYPTIQTITGATGFTVTATAGDTSTYNYLIISNAP